MSRKIPVDLVAKSVNGNIIHTGSKEYIVHAVASGLMSDVLTLERAEMLLISNLTTAQVVRTADMVDANAILFTNNKPISRDTLKLAKELNITVMATKLFLFDACCRVGELFREIP